MPQKVLIVGPVNGRFKELASKVSAIQSKHGPFTACFVVGDFFHPDILGPHMQGDDQLLFSEIKLPIPTYFYQGSVPLWDRLSGVVSKVDLDDEDVKEVKPKGIVKMAKNLYKAEGKSGVFLTNEGLRVAFVGGVWDAQKYAEDLEAQGGDAPFDPETWHESDMDRVKDLGIAHITPATINRLLAHPSFRLPSTSSPSTTTSTNNGTAKPGTLAAARATASAEQARTAASSAALTALQSRPPIDLLLTNCWPTGITLFSPSTPTDPLGGLPDPTARMWGSPAIARLASHACPRYHFSIAPSPPDSLPVGIAEETIEMGAFWERAPYATDLSSYLPNPPARREAERLKTVTRFVSLAKFANQKKRRWFLALNLTPADEQGEVVVPANATQTPYFVPARGGEKRSVRQDGEADGGPNYRFQEPRNKRQRADGGDEVPPKGYVCRICNVEGHYIRSCPSKAAPVDASASNSIPLGQPSGEMGGARGKPHMPLPHGLPSKPAFSTHTTRQMIPVGPSNCWFCLSNPNVAKSLIVSIGSGSYLVYPKGPFIHPSFNAVPFSGGHLLIVPLSHMSSLLPGTHPVFDEGAVDEQEESERERTRAEMEETKAQVRDVWAETGHVMLEWTLVRIRTSSRMTHFQTQLLALLTTVVTSHNLVQILDDRLTALTPSILRGDEVEAYFTRTRTSSQETKEEDDGFFQLTLHPPPGGEKKEWLVPLTTTSRFPVQFVRNTLAEVLEVPRLADWKNAQAAQGEEGEQGEKERSSRFRALLMGRSSA